jgi:hypothetical protein
MEVKMFDNTKNKTQLPLELEKAIVFIERTRGIREYSDIHFRANEPVTEKKSIFFDNEKNKWCICTTFERNMFISHVHYDSLKELIISLLIPEDIFSDYVSIEEFNKRCFDQFSRYPFFSEDIDTFLREDKNFMYLIIKELLDSYSQVKRTKWNFIKLAWQVFTKIDTEKKKSKYY